MGARNTRTRVSEPIHGLTGRIRSLQRGAKTTTTTETDTSITSVDIAKSTGGGHHGGLDTNGASSGMYNYLKDATNVRQARASTSATMRWVVVEEW